MAWQPPPSAQNVPIRPLTKGVHRGVPSQMIPEGGFHTLHNLMVTERGLMRRPGLSRLSAATAIPYTIRELAHYRMPDDNQALLVLTDDTLWAYDPLAGTHEVAWVVASGVSAVVSGVDVTVAGATWLDEDIRYGDLFRVSGYEALVSHVTGDTTLKLVTAVIPNGTYDFTIQASSRSVERTTPDWTVLNDSLIIADGKRPLYKWDGALDSVSYWTADPAKLPAGVTNLVPKTVLALDDRVWMANTFDNVDGYQRQRIRWSALADPTDFSVSTNYIDLPYLSGEIVKLEALGPYLVAYFADGIYIGSRTNFPQLPRRFEQLESGGIGLVGPKAVTSWANTHFFVGQDNVYALGVDGTLAPIGTPMIRDVLTRCKHPEGVYAVSDPSNTQLIFGFPNDSLEIAELWCFNLNTKAWSFASVLTTMISSLEVQIALSWDALTGTWDTLGATYPTWSSMGKRSESQELVVANAGFLWRADPAVTTDFEAEPIPITMETGDLDFGVPDETKVTVRLSLKIHRILASDQSITFTVEGSTNMGRRWKRLGSMTIAPSADEGAVTFRMTGSTHRFRITSSDLSPTFAVTELGLRIRGAGSELSFGTQNG